MTRLLVVSYRFYRNLIRLGYHNMDVNQDNTIPSTTGATILKSCTHTSFLDAIVPRITLVALPISRTLAIKMFVYLSKVLYYFFFSDQAQKRVYRKRVGQDDP